MKINDKNYEVTGDRASGKVQLQVKVYGMCLAAETITPDQARELAVQLRAAATLAEGSPT